MCVYMVCYGVKTGTHGKSVTVIIPICHPAVQCVYFVCTLVKVKSESF